jgi:nitrogen fixation/metabolism regulation signal transduction histidine kinase
MILSIRLKIILIVATTVFIAAGMNAVVNSIFLYDEYTKTTQESANVVGDNINTQLDRLLGLGIPMEDIFGFDDQLRETVDRHSFLSYATVVSTDGSILFHSSAAEAGKRVGPDLLDGMMKNSNAVSYAQDGKKYYSILVPVVHNNEHVATTIVGFSEDVASSKMANAYTASLAVSVLSFLAALVVLFVMVSVWISKPFNVLMGELNKIKENGIYAVKNIEKVSDDELGRLTDTFNELLSSLKKSQDEIRHHAADLEKQVKDRTRDLESTNAELEKFNKLAVGRELKMVELKKKIKELEGK